MQSIVRQLERVRQAAKLLLLLRSASQWVAALLALALILAVADYLLRLPGWLRLTIDVVVVAAAVRWLARQWLQVWRSRPSLSDLALRAERLFPQLAGELASGVELAAESHERAWPARTALLAASSIERARRHARGVQLRRLIDPLRPIRAFGTACALVAAVACVAWFVPQQSATAATRWLTPWGDAEWPLRTRIKPLPHPAVWAADMPLRLRATVERGYHRGMRVWVDWRRVGPAGETGAWQRLLMNEHAVTEGVFQRLIDLPATDNADSAADELPGLPGALPGAVPGAVPGAGVEFRFAAGDDQTGPESITLVRRPELRALSLRIDPPQYARGLIDPQTIDLAQQTGQTITTTVLEGSTVKWDMQLSKPIPPANATLAKLLPDLAADLTDAKIQLSGMSATTDPPASADAPARIVVTFRLDKTVQSAVRLTDAHDLSNLSARQYRLEMIADRPPSAAIADPASDESVLATAIILLQAVAQDDVAVEALALEAEAPIRSDSAQPGTFTTTTLQSVVGRGTALDAAHQLDLTPWQLKPGDEVALTAVARDVFDLDGRRHEPVRSTPRKLTVIEPRKLTEQLNSELAGLRQQAIRLEAQQRRLLDTAAQQAAMPQGQLTRHLEANAAVAKTLRDRIERNRLVEPALTGLVETARALLDQASQASAGARQGLDDALKRPQDAPALLEQARGGQKQVSAKLVDLIEQLDQGRDALTLQLQLQQIQQAQSDLAADVAKALPQTLGKTPDQLDDAARGKLAELARRQSALAARAAALSRQMRTTSEALAQPGATERDQAAAEALAQAASTAERQGLAEKMDSAAAAAGRNQLAAAGEGQSRGLDIMRQMLRQMRQQEERSRQILRRRLLELAEAIENLIERQKNQIELLDKAQELVPLDGPLSILRRNTLAVADQAAASKTTRPTAAELSQATAAQAGAIEAVRIAQRAAATAGEAEALRRLEAALSLVRKQRQAADQEQVRRSREELRQAYEKLAARQDELRNQAEPFTRAGTLNRRQRADTIALGGVQAKLRDDAAGVVEGDDPPPLFSHVHERIDSAADSAAATLEQGQATLDVLDEQASVAVMLRQLAWALARAQRNDPFDKPPGESQPGAGAGGGAGKPPLIPPATQLRLLRAMQETVYQRTKKINDGQAPDTPARRSRLLRLAVDQRELAALGEKLMRSMPGHEPRQPQPHGSLQP